MSATLSKKESSATSKPMIKPTVVVLDDDAVVLMGWEMELQNDVFVVLVESVNQLMQKFADDTCMPQRISCVITDFWLGEQNVLDQNIIEKLRAQNYNGPILLSSNVGPEFNLSAFTATIPKQPMSLEALQEFIK